MQRSSQDVGPAMMGSGPPLRNSNFNNMPPLSVKVQGSDPPPRTMMLPKLPRFPSPPLDSGDISLVLEPDPLRHAELAIEEYVKSELDLRLDTDAQICRANLSPQGCPNGPSCPFRHTKPSHKNFRPPSPKPYSAAAHTVCKHWLRGLCKKGKACEFMHEYNLKKMPECYYFSTTGFCQSGDECMFLHNRPFDKRPDCINFIRGFCPNGPMCPFKHIRRVACPLYLTGFCPRGWTCQLAHPPFLMQDIDRALEQAKAQTEREAAPEAQAPENTSGHSNQQSGRGGGRGGGAGGGRKELLCFKCGQKGHWANACPNPTVPGLRGGIERGAGGRVIAAPVGVTPPPPKLGYGT